MSYTIKIVLNGNDAPTGVKVVEIVGDDAEEAMKVAMQQQQHLNEKGE